MSGMNYRRDRRAEVAAVKGDGLIAGNMKRLEKDPAARLKFAIYHAQQRAKVLADLERRRST